METPNFYAVIPAYVRYDVNLCPNAKLLYGEITALCNQQGYCWASNSYFAELYGVSAKSVSGWIKQLADLMYIRTSIKYKEGSKEILHRYIHLLGEGMEKNFPTPMEKKVKDNTTIINTTINITNNIYTSMPDEHKSLFDEYIAWRKSKKLPLTATVINRLLDKYEQFGKTKDIIENALVAGWKDFYEPKSDFNKGKVNTHTNLSAKDYSTEGF